MPDFYLGLDLGGTNVKAGLTDAQGRLLAKVSVPTGTGPHDLTANRVIARMISAGEQAIEQSGVARAEVAAAGVLAPGQASLAKGIIIRSANLPLWKNVRLRARVSARLGLRAVLENDANAAAYGEWWVGAGRGASVGRKGAGASRHGIGQVRSRSDALSELDSLFMITLGTGVGGGLVYEGKVVHGAFDFATEIGHMIMIPGGEECGCGQRGCLERYTSAKHMAGRAMRMLKESRKLRVESSLGALLKTPGGITSVDIENHARAGDRFAMRFWDETMRILALACINVCHLVDPRMIVIAGGMSKAGRFLLDPLRSHFTGHWWKMTRPTTRIALAKLGNDAGIIGAAGVAREAHQRGALPGVGT